MSKKEGLAGLGLLGACALCCLLPLIGGAAVVGIASFLVKPVVVIGLLLVVTITGIVIYRRRKATASACSVGGCGCSSCATERG